jgi:hypothetical protein
MAAKKRISVRAVNSILEEKYYIRILVLRIEN